MSRTPLPLAGRRFGRLVARDIYGTVETPGGTKRIAWRCQCDCGREAVVRSSDLTSGATKSCGCLLSETSRARHLKHGHGGGATERSREYLAWAGAKQRCTNRNTSAWPDYGGRGIRMCERWRESFEAFLADMGTCPDGFEIDRVDVNGHYEPGNCRWVPFAVQMNNMRTTRYVELGGRQMSVADAARTTGIAVQLVYGRLNNGWSIEEAITVPRGGTRRK